jgi:hypothetical protein
MGISPQTHHCCPGGIRAAGSRDRFLGDVHDGHGDDGHHRRSALFVRAMSTASAEARWACVGRGVAGLVRGLGAGRVGSRGARRRGRGCRSARRAGSRSRTRAGLALGNGGPTMGRRGGSGGWSRPRPPPWCGWSSPSPLPSASSSRPPPAARATRCRTPIAMMSLVSLIAWCLTRRGSGSGRVCPSSARRIAPWGSRRSCALAAGRW